MTAGGSPSYLHEVAGRLREDAVTVKEEGAKTRQAMGMAWSGTTADMYRHKLETLAGRLEDDYNKVLGAASKVDALAVEVQQVQAAIQLAMHSVQQAMHEAQRTVQTLGDIAWDMLTGHQSQALDHARGLLERIVHLPEAGSPLWLNLAEQARNR